MKKTHFCAALILAMALVLTGCGNKEEAASFIDETTAIAYAENCVEALGSMQGMDASYYAEYPEVEAALNSLNDASEELGNYIGIVSGSSACTISDSQAVVNVLVQGDKLYNGGKQRTANAEVILDEQGMVSCTYTIKYDMNELMAKAGLNTLLGMGTVFTVLILISLIISCFKFIPKIQEAFSNRKNQKAAAAEATADRVVEQIAVKEETAYTDDLELVAVITAAIAASEGTSADGFVVRSIIRR